LPPSERLRRPLMRLDGGDDGRRAGGALIPVENVERLVFARVGEAAMPAAAETRFVRSAGVIVESEVPK